MNPEQKIGAILLAAGASARMGRPKQLLKFQGQTLVRRAALAALDAGCDPVIVVTGSSSELVARELLDLPVQTVFHPGWSAGMGSSLRAGLAAIQIAQPNLAAVVVLVSDQPYMNGEVLHRLMDGWRSGKKSMAAFEYAGTTGPPCCFGHDKLSDLSSISDNQGAKSILAADPANLTTLPWPQGAVDWDRPEDISDQS
jgi:molybdenum cofactor cytidylyltransferase